jgi:hypothetical protein
VVFLHNLRDRPVRVCVEPQPDGAGNPIEVFGNCAYDEVDLRNLELSTVTATAGSAFAATTRGGDEPASRSTWAPPEAGGRRVTIGCTAALSM